jgi:hypothetical protein
MSTLASSAPPWTRARGPPSWSPSKSALYAGQTGGDGMALRL